MLKTLIFLLAITGAVAATPLPRISADKKGFRIKATGAPFLVRGVNWVRLAKSPEKWPANVSFDIDYFPAHRAEIAATLARIAGFGFNVVRYRIDARTLEGQYVENIIAFQRMANQAGLYVLPTFQKLPNAANPNSILLDPVLQQTTARYEANFLRQIKTQAPELMPGILAIDIWNEQSFSAREFPFNQDSGSFNGVDLSDAKARQALADKATADWVNTVTRALKEVDAEVMVTSSVFTPREVRRRGYEGVYLKDSGWGDWRQPLRLTVLEKTDVDYLEIHPYPHGSPTDLEEDLNSLEFSRLQRSKPVLVGEFGAFKKDFPSVEAALPALQAFLEQAARKGLAGWIFWTWDTYEQNRADDLWNLTDQDYSLARSLAPRH